METDAHDDETPEAAARRALRQAFDSGSSHPLAEAADLLVETVMSHPELMKLLQGLNEDELAAIAEAIPNGFAARLANLGLTPDVEVASDSVARERDR